jgi:hypothetical protein
MAEDKGPIRRAFMDAKSLSASQGYKVGLMDGAVELLKIVHTDVLANLVRVPNHKLSAEAEEILGRAIREVQGLSARLADIACGDE